MPDRARLRAPSRWTGMTIAYSYGAPIGRRPLPLPRVAGPRLPRPQGYDLRRVTRKGVGNREFARKVWVSPNGDNRQLLRYARVNAKGAHMRRDGQAGQAFVIAALGLTVLLLAAGLAVDMGYMRY